MWTLSRADQLAELSESAAVPIGRAIGNTQLYVLGPGQQLQPVGSVGELYIGGAGVARGYLNQELLTQERFVANPFGAGRLYRTGDRVRHRADGELEFLGRIDEQVKIRGFRIELGEIEAQLTRQSGVREAVVVVREEEPGEKRLVAYVVGTGEVKPEAAVLRDALMQGLPEYMVPAVYVMLDALPLTPNGKVDRRALPAPDRAISTQRDHAEPRGPVETTLALIWRELLHLERVGRNDHFFELGGQSLLAVRMISRLRQCLGLDVSLSCLFTHPVLRDFARVASEMQTTVLSAPSPVARPDSIPLSFAQHRLWLAAQFGKEASAAYNMPVGLQLRGRLDEPALQAALDCIVRRHEALRTHFERVDDQPVQRVGAPERFALVHQDLEVGCEEREAAVAHWSQFEAREPFDLGRGPLIRGRLLRLDAYEHVLLLTMHHIVSDGWSLGVLADELGALYRAYAVEGVAYALDPLAPLPVQYADYALWQRRWLDAPTQERLLAYWCTQLAGSPLLSALPTDHPRPPTQGFVGGMVYAQVREATTAALNELADRHTSTLFMVLMAAFNVLLSRYSGQTDLNVGTVVANRNRAELEPLIGLLLDTQVIRTRLDPAQSFESLLQQVRATLIQAYVHQDLPFDTLLERLKPVRRPGVPPLFQVMLNLQNMPDKVVTLPELSLKLLPPCEHSVKCDLTLYMTERDGVLEIAYEYDVALFEAATIERLAARFTRLLEAVVATPAARIDELGVADQLLAMAPEIAPMPDVGARRQLSAHQQRLWFIDVSEAGILYESAPTYHNLPLLLELGAAVSPAHLEAALNLVVARHDALRTRIGSDGSIAWQSVDEHAPLTLEQIHLKDGESLLTRAVAEVERPFKLDRDRLIRASLLGGRDGETWLCIAVHHIVADRRSLQLLAQELVNVYAAIVAGRTPPLPALPLTFGDHLRWQAAFGPEVLESWLLYWKLQLRGRLQAIELPLSRPRSAVLTFTAGQLGFAVNAQTAERLRALAQNRSVTVEDVLLTGFNALLRRYAGHDELVIGTSVAGRDPSGLGAVVGPLANLLALRTAVPVECDFETLLASVARTRARAVQHGDMPFDLLVLKLSPERDTSRAALFDVVFQYDEHGGQVVRSGAIAARMVETNLGYGKYDLHLYVFPQEGGFEARLVYNARLFDEWLIAQMMRHFVCLLHEMTGDPGRRIDYVPLLDSTEHERVCVEWNSTQREYPRSCVQRQFEAQAARTPEAVAVRIGEQELSYTQLNAKANRLARYLLEAGVAPGARVGIYLSRSAELLIAVLGVLKAGAAYVPLEPKLPKGRLGYMVQDAGIGWVLLEAARMDELALQGVDVVLMDGAASEEPWLEEYSPDDGGQPALPEVGLTELAYVIYTSGSTGQPKGVMVEHRGLSNYLAHAVRSYLPGLAGAVVSSPLCFDATLTTLLPPLLVGKPVWLLPDDEHTLAHLSERLFACGEEGWLFKITPAHLEALSYLERGVASCPAPHWIVVGGEQLASATLHRWKGELLPQASFVNEYGPTETVVGCSVWTLSRADQLAQLSESRAVPIGRAIGNTQLYVLGPGQQLQPVGSVGELYIGGAGVARGYLNQGLLTQERFVANPFGAGRLYRTGDRVRHRADGELEFLGRIDEQVKIRGFRIELGEIEAQLTRQSGVREAVVVVREEEPGEKRLVAYVVGTGEVKPEAAVLRDALMQGLPEYMVPAVYVMLDALPLTPNGKVDRRALPAPDRAISTQRDHAEPQGPVETTLALIWRELLHLERVGRNDHFFELGGNSLLALRLVSQLRRQQLHLDIRVLFAQPTLSALAQAIEEAERAGRHGVDVPANSIRQGSERITPEMLPLLNLDQAQIERIVAEVPGGAANVQDIYPLAPLQEGILFHHLLQTRGDTYLLSTILSFDSRARLDAFVRALQQVIDRHDVLRTAVLWEGLPEPVQVVWRQARFEVRTPELPEGDTIARLTEHADPRHYRMDVHRAPLMRGFDAFDRRTQRWLLQLVHHHLVLDHMAMDVLLHEIGMILSDRAQELPTPVPFRNFVAQARLGVSAQEHEAFFRQMLGDVDEPTAPFGLLDMQGDGEDVHEARAILSPELSRRLRHQARTLGVSMATLFHWTWAQVLAKTSGREDVVFGTVLFGRLQGGADTDRAMGLFINTLPVRIQSGELSVREGIRQTHATLLSLMRHEHASLALVQRCSALSAGTPLFSAVLNYRHSAEAPDGASPRNWAQGMEVLLALERTNYVPFILSVDDLGEGFELIAQIVKPIEPQRVCTYMRNALEHLAEALERAPQTPSWQIGVLGEVERRQVLVSWNDTRRSWPQDACIHELFERQVVATPQAPALEGEDRRLSYEDLNGRANRLARHLCELGVQPDERVAICLPRSVEMIVAILAVLKAGGAYVPLDPSYPQERLDYMLRDSRPRVLLTDATVLEQLPASRALMRTTVVDMAEETQWQHLSHGNVGRGLSPAHLAYVIYTSGSTGAPKGVMVTHQGLCNLSQVQIARFTLGPDSRVLQFASSSFDACIWEVVMALISGACLYLPPPGVLAGAELADRLGAGHITHATLPPAVLASLPATTALPSLQALVLAGEAPTAAQIKRWAPGRRLFNAYGPTEATVCASMHECDVCETVAPPIGKPIDNTRLYILDGRHEPTPVGVTGELYIAGVQLARGYLNRPELTAARFLPDPFAAHPGERMYRTGDLARWRSDGSIDFLGRNDQQIKIRGFRIEIGEIEATLLSQPGVREVLVLVREDSPGDKHLVAYVAGVEGVVLEPQSLRRALAEVLPDYMVPAAYVVLEGLPLTPNGKVDRRALPAPGAGSAHSAYEPPEGETETRLARIWSELLRVELVGRNDHFFELGGHSLLATQMISRVRGEWDIEISLVTLFARARLAEFSEAIVDCQLAQFDAADLESIVARQKDVARQQDQARQGA